jgi:hypothetical protein
LRPHLGAREFVAFWHRAGEVPEAVSVLVWDVVMT